MTNNGSPCRFSAEVRILAVVPNRPFKTHKFDGCWVMLTRSQEWMNLHEDLIPEIKIETNKSKRLKVASVISPIGIGTQIMELVGIDGEAITWELPFNEQVLPSMEIEVIVVGNGYAKPFIKRYKVGPRTATGPLQMTEVSV